MRRSPSIIPESDDQDIYLVLNDFGAKLGRAWRETDEERTDRKTLIADLLSGRYLQHGRGLVARRLGRYRRRAGAADGRQGYRDAGEPRRLHR